MDLLPAGNLCDRRNRFAALQAAPRVLYAVTALLLLLGALLARPTAAAVKNESPGWRILFAKLDAQNRFVRLDGIRLIAIKQAKVPVIVYRAQSGGIKRIPFTRVIALARGDDIRRHSHRRRVYLKDGSWLIGESILSNGNNFRIKTDFGTVVVPVIDATGLGMSRHGIIRRKAVAHDRLFFIGGGLLKGTFLACNIDGIKMHSALGIQVTPWSRVKELALGGLPTGTGGKLTAKIELLDGSVLHAAALKLASRQFTIDTQSGLTLHIPESTVGKINTLGGDVTWLAAIPPEKYQQKPLFGKPWPIEFNRNAVEGTLRASGVIYRHGVGLHAPCTVTYRLGGRYRYLVFAAQMDDSAGKIGRGEVSVKVDGRNIYSSGVLVVGHPPVFVKLPVEHAESLTITTHAAGFLATRCRIDLLDAALIR